MKTLVVASFIVLLAMPSMAFSGNPAGELRGLLSVIELSAGVGSRQVPQKMPDAARREGFEPPEPIQLGCSTEVQVQMAGFGRGDFAELESAKEDLKKMYEYLGENMLDQVRLRIECVRKKIDDYEQRQMKKNEVK